nr:hypothetical protein [Tanacetum cinerariifolium]
MDLFAFIQVVNPTKVKVREWEHAEEEAKLLNFTIRRVVLLLLVAPACSENELEASVKRLFHEGGSSNQADFAADGETKGDYEVSSEAAIYVKSSTTLRELLASSLLNFEVGVTAVSTLPAGGKDHLPMLAPGNYVQLKSRIKRYIDTKPNHELIYYCLKNPPYKFTWADKEVPISEGIDNDIYSTVDACPNACEMWKAIERLKQGESINVQDLETNLYWEFRKFTLQDEPSIIAEDDEMSKDKEIDKLMALISLSFKKIYKPTNNNLQTLSNTSKANQDNSPRINKGVGYDNQRVCNVVGARETVDAVDSGPIFNTKPVQKVQNNENYNVFAIEIKHPEQSKSIHDTYPIEQDEHNVIIDSLDMSYDREQIDQNDDDNDLVNERELLAS